MKRLDNQVPNIYVERLKHELSVIKNMGFIDYFLIVYDYVKFAKENNVDTIYYTEIDETKVIPKYIYYFIQDMHLDRLNIAGGVPSMTQATLNKLDIAIPSLEEQKRVVDILDKFDKLVNDITTGIPAEIELRRKQYEYYRNELLSFEELDYETIT